MSKPTWERKGSHRSSTPYDYPRPRNRYRSRSPEYSEYHEAVRTTRGDIPYRVRESRHFQITTGTKRKRIEEEQWGDGYSGARSDDDEAYVVMEVTRREQREILERRMRQDDRGREYSDNRDHRNNRGYRSNTRGPPAGPDRRYDNEYYSDRKRNDTNTKKVSLFGDAENFVISGGRTSVVGGNQTIIEKNHRHPSPEPHIRSNFQRPRSRDFSPPTRMQDRSDSSNTAKSTADAFARAKNFEIMGGEFSAVEGNQTISYSTRSFEDREAQDNKALSTRQNFINQKDFQKPLEDSLSSINRTQFEHSLSAREQAISDQKPGIQSQSGPSVLGFASKVLMHGLKAHPGSFSAVGGNQNITVGAYSDSEGSDYYG